MSIDHRVVVYEGERLGDLISCGPRYRFFTTLPHLASLDGRAFGGQAEVIAAALPLIAAVRARPGVQTGAKTGTKTGAETGGSAPGKRDLDRGAAIAVDAVPRTDRHALQVVRKRDAA